MQLHCLFYLLKKIDISFEILRAFVINLCPQLSQCHGGILAPVYDTCIEQFKYDMIDHCSKSS